jgi:hypothetical protein
MDDALLKAKERQIFQRVLTSAPGGGVEECHMVGYGNGRYRAHAIGPDGKEIHVTDLRAVTKRPSQRILTNASIGHLPPSHFLNVRHFVRLVYGRP